MPEFVSVIPLEAEALPHQEEQKVQKVLDMGHLMVVHPLLHLFQLVVHSQAGVQKVQWVVDTCQVEETDQVVGQMGQVVGHKGQVVGHMAQAGVDIEVGVHIALDVGHIVRDEERTALAGGADLGTVAQGTGSEGTGLGDTVAAVVLVGSGSALLFAEMGWG